MVRAFLKNGYMTTLQYGPLYPFLISFLFDPTNVVSSYEYIRLFNSIIFCLSFFPLYYFSTDLNLKAKSAFPLTMLCVLMPWSSLTPLIWAEPLYYFLYSTLWFLAYRALSRHELRYFILLGINSALLILTKQHAIVFITAFIIVFLISSYRNYSIRSLIIKNFIAYIIPLSLAGVFYIWNSQMSPGAGALGYNSATTVIQKRIFELLVLPDLYKTFILQWTYTFVATYGFPLSILFYFLINPKHIKNSEHNFLILIALCTAGISALTALFFNTMFESFGATNEPLLTNGRYLAPVFPAIIIFCFSIIPKLSVYRNWMKIVPISIAFLILLGLLSPLSAAWAISIANSPDISFLSRLFQINYLPWEQSTASAWAEQYSWQAALWFAGLVAASHVAAIKRPAYAVFIFLFALLNGDVAFQNIRYLGDVTHSEHATIRYVLDNKIDFDHVFADSTIYTDQFKYWSWLGHERGQIWLTKNKVKSLDDAPASSYVITKKVEELDKKYSVIFSSGEYTLVKK
jgi:hypothetical protein